ncbi:uncharacterized protein LOC34621511 [Cyclospora cayetanensis]|uniref:Uncharacterized protein LOC34621511 n=1 Tax=Cyclospora cayetanensis TaxID=88456 RepID=A0A6P6S1A3_9EIME|nr:uncharacterized protein LOC34621511 [Cyclospora cayetanensis]
MVNAWGATKKLDTVCYAESVHWTARASYTSVLFQSARCSEVPQGFSLSLDLQVDFVFAYQKALELLDLCDEWTSPEHRVAGGTELEAELNGWLHSQGRRAFTLGGAAPRFQVPHASPVVDEEMQTLLALAVSHTSGKANDQFRRCYTLQSHDHAQVHSVHVNGAVLCACWHICFVCLNTYGWPFACRAESDHAILASEQHTSLGLSQGSFMVPVVDVYHRPGSAPVFTANSRVVHRGRSGELSSPKLRRGSTQAAQGGASPGSPADSFFTAIFGLLLPVILASALNDTTNSTKNDHSHKHHNKYHRRHHHHEHQKHEHHHNDKRRREQQESSSHTHVGSILHRSTVGSANTAAPNEAVGRVLGNNLLAGISEATDESSSSYRSGAGWVILTGLAVLGCMATVAAWRALLLKRLRTKNAWKAEDTQLMTRPHAQ